MQSMKIVFCALLLAHGAWCVPATDSKTNGVQVSTNMGNSLDKASQNIQSGLNAAAKPIASAIFDKLPGVWKHAASQAGASASKIAESKKEGGKKIAAGLSNAAGGGVEMASAAVAVPLHLVGGGMQAISDMAESGAKFGIDMSAELVNSAALANEVTATIIADALTTAGKLMAAGGMGANTVGQESSKIIEAIGKRIANSITLAKETLTKMMKEGGQKLADGTLKVDMKVQEEFAKAILLYMELLMGMESMIEKMSANIIAGMKT